MKWRVSELKAVDKNGRVVKDEDGGFVLNQRDPRVWRYRVRWYLGEPDFSDAHNKMFRHDQRVDAERFVESLRQAAEREIAADSHGLPADARNTPLVSEPPVVPSQSLVDAVTFAFEALKPRWTAPNTLTHHRLGLQFFVHAVTSGRFQGWTRTRRR